MGFWTEIKYALNSTLGTDKFQPLDKLLYNGKSLVASENLYMILFESEEYEENTNIILPKKIKTKSSGSFRVNTKIAGPYPGRRTYFRIYINGILLKEEYQTGSDYEEVTYDVIYLAGDEISFGVEVEKTYASEVYTYKGKIGDVYICADVIDTSLIDIELIK